MSVDTLSLAKELRAADFAPTQAEAIAAVICRSVVEAWATKVDLAQLGAELRTDIAKRDAKIEASTNQLLFGFVGTQLAVAGIVIALIKLLPSQV